MLFGFTGSYMILSCVYAIIILHRPCIFPLASPPTSSLLLFLNNNTKTTTTTKKNSRNKSHKVFWMKTNACRDGTLKKQPNYMEMTPQHFHTIPTSCAIQVAKYAHPIKLYMHAAYSYALNEESTRHCSLHSLPLIHIYHVQQQ